MALRFQKRIKVLPGVKLNVSGSGLGLSLGARGASMSIGKRGTYLNAGIPGTGLSMRSKVGPGSARPGQQAATPELSGNAVIALHEDGSVSFSTDSGQELPKKLVASLKQEHASQIAQMLTSAAASINADLDACLGIHLATPSPATRPTLPAPVEVPMPVKPEIKHPGLLDLILFRAQKVRDRNSAISASYDDELVAWRKEQADMDELRRQLTAHINAAGSGDLVAMEATADYVLGQIPWPKETIVSYVVSDDRKAISVDVDLPDEGDTPRTTAEVSAKADKLLYKKRSDAQVRKDFVALCYGSIFRVAGELFAALPSISSCTVSGYIQRRDAATGAEVEDYIISVVIERGEWSKIAFDSLDMIDPAATLKRFNARVSLDRSSVFKPIEPFGAGAQQ